MPPPKSVKDLPATLPVFPLQGALLLPGARLPLNIFEPRYLAMVDDALASHRMIGMIQPKVAERQTPDDRPELYPLGCAGRLTSFEETPDNRYLITLSGVCRFDVADELPLEKGYRQVTPDYAAWAADFGDDRGDGIDRDRLAASLRTYLSARQMKTDWEGIEKTSTRDLIAIVSMICPFSPLEKQALLECRTLTDRAALIISLLQMGSAGSPAPDSVN